MNYMHSVFKREFLVFYRTSTGYVITGLYLLANSLFLWVIPGNYNTLTGGYASLDGFFSLSPWLLLFMVPALTMRMFAEEYRTGTIEPLLTKPAGSLKIVVMKYLACLTLLLTGFVPTIVYVFTTGFMAQPQFNIDWGFVIGGYFGLLFIGSAFVSVGLWASSKTNNQVVAFLIAFGVLFLFYDGFSQLASVAMLKWAEPLFMQLSFGEKYMRLGRGLLDSRDVIYFIAFSAMMLWLTKIQLNKKR
jgi:ABC-2 type transport system permease protein